MSSGELWSRAMSGHSPAEYIVANVRDRTKATALADRGVQVRAGDLDEPEHLAAAFEDAEQVLGPQSTAWVDGADGSIGLRQTSRRVGARRMLHTGRIGTHAGPPFGDHHAAEAVLAEAGIRFTSLRHDLCAEGAPHLIGRGFEAGEVRAPGDRPVNWTARADLADADAVVPADV